MTTTVEEKLGEKLPPEFTGPEKYWQAAESWFGVQMTPEQRDIHETVAENQYTLVEGANGFGKTYAIVCLALAFFYRHPGNSSVVVTSGTFGKLKRTFCADAKALHNNAPLFGEWKESPNPHIDVNDNPTWQFEAHSPADPEELEGVHNKYTLIIVDEADKEEVTDATIDSVDSLISDENDRMVVVCNPPKDETNVVYQLREDPNYNRLQYSTFDSHNVRVERDTVDPDGDVPTEKVHGLTGLSKLKKKWQSYNNEPWPGFEQARNAHERRNDLDARWYRRHAGVMPPEGAAAHRPFDLDDVERGYDHEAIEREWRDERERRGVGIDVARSGDRTAMVSERHGTLTVDYSQPGTNHTDQFDTMWDDLDDTPEVRMAVDAVGEGSGKADDTRKRYPRVERFKAGADAVQEHEYKNRWTEGLCELGDWLARGGTFTDTALREELAVAARTISLDEKYYASREAEVVVADSKEAIKQELGRSPDHLDAAVMAVLAAEDVLANAPRQETRRRSGRDAQGRRTIRRNAPHR